MRLLILNLLRKPLRTLLTVFGVSIALLLFCFLETVLNAFNAGVEWSNASRLVVQHRESLAMGLPVSYAPQIRQVEGVERVAVSTWFGGIYEEQKPGGQKREEFFAQFGMDLANYFPMYPEIKIPPDQLRDLMSDQIGCVMGSKIADRLGKKVGDTIRLRSTFWNKADGAPWEFNVRAIYTTDSPTFDQTMMLFHAKYLDEGREFGRDTCGIFILSISDPERYTEISSAIDKHFQNSPAETRTINEKAFQMQFVSMMGNLKLLLRSIGSAVVLTMLLISANTMMMSARERTPEMAILKSIGFTDWHVAGLLVAESMLIALLGALAGAGGSWLAINILHFNPKPDFFPVFYLPASSLFAAFGIAAATGLLSGLVPAIAGMRLKATEALRSV